MIKNVIKENKLLIIFSFYYIFSIASYLTNQIGHPAIGNTIQDYLQLMHPIGILLFICGAFLVNEKNIKTFHIACKILIPLRIIFGSAGVVTVIYIKDSLYHIKSGQATFGELLSIEDGFLFFTILPFIVTALVESFILIKITEHKINEGSTASNKAFGVAALLYGLFGNSAVLYMNIVRGGALTNAKGITEVAGYIISGLIIVVFAICIIKTDNIKLVKLLKISYCFVVSVLSTAYMVQMLTHNYRYTGFSYLDVCNILSILTVLTFALVITGTGELYVVDKMHKKEESLL